MSVMRINKYILLDIMTTPQNTNDMTLSNRQTNLRVNRSIVPSEPNIIILLNKLRNKVSPEGKLKCLTHPLSEKLPLTIDSN